MGLDNFPHEYPCKRQGTAVIEKRTHTWTDDEGKVQSEDSYPIDCEATADAGGCPFLNADPPAEGAVLGMLGTHCWYRGKYGNWLLRALSSNTTDIDAVDDLLTDYGDDNFYGTDADGLHRPAGACLSLADQMESALDERDGKLVFINDGEEDDRTADAKYAIWYLRWVAKECDGMGAWY